MKENNLINARYFCILLGTLNEVVKHLVNEISVRKVYQKESKNLDGEIVEILKLAQELMNLMDPKFHKEELLEGVTFINEIFSQLIPAGI